MKTNSQLQNELVEEFRTMTPGADDLQKCDDSVEMASNGPSRTADITDPQTDAAEQSGSASPQVPSHEDIAQRAFDIYLKKGRPQGQCQQNWWEAEQELNIENQVSKRRAPMGQRNTTASARRATPLKTPAMRP
jgi:hypothetical protein